MFDVIKEPGEPCGFDMTWDVSFHSVELQVLIMWLKSWRLITDTFK